jgi:hypothetical protein
MPAGIRLYFEGDKRLREGFKAFLAQLGERARQERCVLRPISGRSGDQARQDFETALKNHPDAWSVLLIDSDGPLPNRGAGKHARRTFWMVEMMESWFHAGPASINPARVRKAAPNCERLFQALAHLT